MSTFKDGKSNIINDKDFKVIEKVISDFILTNNRFPSIQAFNAHKPNDLEKINFYLIKYDIRFDYLLSDVLGYTELRTPVQNRINVFHKKKLLEVISKEFKANLPKSKRFQERTGMSLKTIKDLFGFTYLELLEHLEIKHPLLELKDSREFDVTEFCIISQPIKENKLNEGNKYKSNYYKYRTNQLEYLTNKIDKGANIQFIVKDNGDIVVSPNTNDEPLKLKA